MRISARGGISALNASVNSAAPSPPPLPPLPPRAGPGHKHFFFCLELQIPGGWDSSAVKNPGVGLKKRASAPFSVNTATFFIDRTDRIVPF